MRMMNTNVGSEECRCGRRNPIRTKERQTRKEEKRNKEKQLVWL